MKLTIEINDSNNVIKAAQALLAVTHHQSGEYKGQWIGLNFIDTVKLMKTAEKLNDAVLNYGTVQVTKRRS